MIVIREIISIMFFAIAVVGAVHALINDFNPMILVISLILYVLAYFIWPSKRRGGRDDNSWVFEIFFEILIEFPVEFMKYFLRFFSRMFGKTGDGIDFDI